MALLKFFEGKESSYSSSSHSGGLYFAKDTGVILFKGVKYGSKPDLSNYATKSDISSLRSELGNKADSNHEHTIDDISDLIIANSDHDGLMPSSMYNKLNKLKMIEAFSLYYKPGRTDVNIYGALFSEESHILSGCQPSFRLSAATSDCAGVMSSYDKRKLDSLANVDTVLLTKENFGSSIDIKLNIESDLHIQSTTVSLSSASTENAGLMSADDKKKLDSLANTLQALSVQPLNDSSEISPASLIGSDRYDILKGITDNHIGVNAQFTDGKLTIGLYDFNESEWVGAPSVTIPLQ